MQIEEVEIGRKLAANLVECFPDSDALITRSDIEENTKIEECCSNFFEIFGEPKLTKCQALLLHLHSSALSNQVAEMVNKEQSDSLVTLGKNALATVISCAVFEHADESSAGQDIAIKSNFIGTSNFILQEFHRFKLLRVIVGKGMSPLSGKGNERAFVKICTEVLHRYIGHLFLTRPWETFYLQLKQMIDVENNFPLKSYKDWNSKAVLQQWCQQDFDAAPIYEVVEESGADHEKHFQVVVKGGKKGNKILAYGEGRTRKEAEFSAASVCLAELNIATNERSKKITNYELPDWLMTRCMSIGAVAVQDVTGVGLPTDLLIAVLVPFGNGRTDKHLLRERLAVVGARFRQLLGFRRAAMSKYSASEATHLSSHINSNQVLLKVVADSQLNDWIDTLSQTENYAHCSRKGPTIDTLNALFGAIGLQHGIEALRPVETLLFAGYRKGSVSTVPARGKLQQILQAKAKERYNELFDLQTAQLHEKHEGHNPRIQVTLYFKGVEIGCAEAGNKKSAAEKASEQALANPRLSELLDGFE